jgi:CheY-like chemotaxis protein
MTSVMVVEDDVLIRMGICSVLQVEGYEILEAANGLEALQRLRQHPLPCLIILDLMMPVMDGIAFRAEQLRDSTLSSVPVVVLTGRVNAKEITEKLSVEKLIMKPFSLTEVLSIVNGHCGR